MQGAIPAWPAGAVHDTVQAVVRQPAFRRTLTNSLLDRLLLWLGEALSKLLHALQGIPGGRTVVISIAFALALLVVVRLLVAAQARDGGAIAFGSRRGAGRGEDPWRAAERLAASGDFEGAAHAMYRGVLASLQQGEKLRLDPAKTSGDYARELRARGSPALASFRAFARRFDYAVYGRGVCDAALCDDLLRLADPLRRRDRAA